MNPLNPFDWSVGLFLVFILFLSWTIVWKVYAVWLAAKNDHKKWFVALLIFNTFSILELIYIFHVLKKNTEEVKEAFKEAISKTK